MIRFSNQIERIENISNLLQLLTLVFGIFVGYYAFLQVAESRFEKLKESANDYLSVNSLLRARQVYEEAHKIKPLDIIVLENLEELYLLEENYAKFDETFPLMEKSCVELDEQLAKHYLLALKGLLELGSTNGIRNCLNFVRENPEALRRFTWNFQQLKHSKVYEKTTGDTRTILDNFAQYLGKSLSEERKILFETSNYLLNVVSVPPPNP